MCASQNRGAESDGEAHAALTPERLKEIAERCEKASPGVWRIGPALDGFATVSDGDEEANFGEFIVAQGMEDADAAFIAAARSDIPALLAEVARLVDLAEKRSKEIDRVAGEAVLAWARICELESHVNAATKTATDWQVQAYRETEKAKAAESALRESQERVGRLETALKDISRWGCRCGSIATTALASPHRGAGSGDEGRTK